jgi:hypothetical protein
LPAASELQKQTLIYAPIEAIANLKQSHSVASTDENINLAGFNSVARFSKETFLLGWDCRYRSI